MQQPLVEPERAPDSLVALPEQAHAEARPAPRASYLRLTFPLFIGALLAALAVVLFFNGVRIISLNRHALSLLSQNYNEPRPFLLIGLWAIAVLLLGIFSVLSFTKTARRFVQVRRRSGSARRKAA